MKGTQLGDGFAIVLDERVHVLNLSPARWLVATL
jgi:hypothetical protein